MATSTPPIGDSPATPRRSRHGDAPVVVFDDVSLAFDDKVILEGRQLRAAAGPDEDHPRRERRREVDDPAADPRPAQARRRRASACNGQRVDEMSEAD